MKKLLFIFLSIAFLCSCRVQQPMSGERFAEDVRKDVPFRVMEMAKVQDNPNVYSFKCDQRVGLMPDYEVDAEGSVMGYRTTFVQSHEKQPANMIWRNIVINKSAKRVLCVDRLLKDGKTFGYIYVLQSETKEYSDENTYHWDVSDHRLLLTVAAAIEYLSDLSVTTLNTLLQ